MENDLWWKTPSVADNIRLKTNFIKRHPLVEDDPQWKTTFSGKQPLVEDSLWWKTTYGGRRPSMEDDFWRKTILACCLVRFAAFFVLFLAVVCVLLCGSIFCDVCVMV